MQVELWRGASLLDGSPIVALANGPSPHNTKTGPMLQCWILPADIDPISAQRAGLDVGICGTCTMGPGREPGTKAACYVLLHHGPRASWASWQRGTYRRAAPSDLRGVGRGLPVRLGAYGDPAAVPVWVWERLLSAASGWTGYTHQWREGLALSDLVMASTETDADSDRAISEGWRVYQVTKPGTPRRKGFAMCPHYASGGSVQCYTCGLCNGSTGAKAQIQIPLHGAAARKGLPIWGQQVAA